MDNQQKIESLTQWLQASGDKFYLQMLAEDIFLATEKGSHIEFDEIGRIITRLGFVYRAWEKTTKLTAPHE